MTRKSLVFVYVDNKGADQALRLYNSKYRAMIGCLRTRVRKQPIIALHFESENELKLYNLEVRLRTCAISDQHLCDTLSG